MKRFTEIREARRSAQDRLSARASKHGLGSQKRLDKIKKSADFFSKPPPSFSKAELKKMGYAVEKTLTSAEKKKKEEIAKAIERDNPDMPMAKKMAIATATAKRVAEGKNDYPIYHKTYSGAMQASYAFAKKKGFEVDKSDIDDKVATGPKKPSNGKTNSFTLKLVGQKNKRLAVQVTNLDNRRYELNCYIT